MTVKIKAYNDKRSIKRMEKLADDVVLSINRTLASSIIEMDSDIKTKIQTGSRSGRTYKRGLIRHKASAKNELPKTDTGKLVSGFMFKTPRRKGSVLRASLENRSAHAKYLEFKPKVNGGRPFMRPTFNKWKPIIAKRLSKLINKQINKYNA